MYDDKLPDGWVIPTHSSLTTITLTAGIHRNIAVLLWSITLLVIFQTWAFHLIVISIALHFVLAYVTKRDNQFMSCLARSLQYSKFYE